LTALIGRSDQSQLAVEKQRAEGKEQREKKTEVGSTKREEMSGERKWAVLSCWLCE